MSTALRFSQWVFFVAGIYGIVLVGAMYFMEGLVNTQFPPAISHPEYYYGFIGVTIAWQFVFLIIGKDPQRYRLLMLPAIIEKWSYTVALIILYSQARIVFSQTIFGAVDCVLGLLFLTAFVITRDRSQPGEAS